MAEPALSILIPNYDNGRAASVQGDRDFVGDLLASLHETLVDDPTPLEIVIGDDGSTDDSLATCRRWAERRWGGWRGREPFCRLLEFEHTGVLSVVANRLTVEARAPVVCRLDGDIVVGTPRWARAILEAFERGGEDLGVIGPLQLLPDGRVHSAGSWVLHPRGHHHVAQGAAPEAMTRSIEVDHVMGCFYCHRRRVWEELGGYDEDLLRGQTVDFGLRARLAGWRTWAIPSVRFIHAHAERRPRAGRADSGAGIAASLAAFEAKWGFSRIAPDLEEVAARYRGTPLLWNARFFGPAAPWPPVSAAPLRIEDTEWARYAADDGFRAALDARVRLVDALAAADGPRRRVLHVYARTGLVAHLLGRAGHPCLGLDPDPHRLDLARAACARGAERAAALPRFEQITDDRRWPVDDRSADTVLLCDMLEHHANPVGVLKAARRALADGGALIVAARMRAGALGDDVDRTHPYRRHELVGQVRGTGLFEPRDGVTLPEVPGMVTLLATATGRVAAHDPESVSRLEPSAHVSV